MPVTKITKEIINEVVSESVLAHYPSNDDPTEEFFDPDDPRLEYYRIKTVNNNGDRYLTSVNYVNREGRGQFVDAVHIDALVMQMKQAITIEELLDGKWWLIDIEIPPDSE